MADVPNSTFKKTPAVSLKLPFIIKTLKVSLKLPLIKEFKREYSLLYIDGI